MGSAFNTAGTVNILAPDVDADVYVAAIDDEVIMKIGPKDRRWKSFSF